MSEQFRASDGRVPGERGLATRQRLLEATVELIEQTGYRTVKVVDIARQAGTSPATFYQYFADVQAAVLAACAEMIEAGAAEFAVLVEGASWTDDEAGAAAKALARGFIDFWEHHRSLLRVLDLSALEGDERFRDLRVWMLNGVTVALQTQASDAGVDDLQAMAVAGAVVSLLSHVAAYHRGLVEWGVESDDLIEVMATMMLTVLSGSAPPF